MEDIIRKCNLIVDLLKFISNKKYKGSLQSFPTNQFVEKSCPFKLMLAKSLEWEGNCDSKIR